MRYYEFRLATTAEELEKTAKIKLNKYAYGSTVSSLNNLLYSSLKNEIYCFAYREEQTALLTAFAYNERTSSFQEAYDHIFFTLNQAFVIHRTKKEPCEITMQQMYEDWQEGRRRDYCSVSTKMLWSMKINTFDEYYMNQQPFRFGWKETIISMNAQKGTALYDSSLIDEMSNIERHKNTSGFRGNIAHYIISGRSAEAAADMTASLMQKLAEANRLGGKRMGIITEIEPDVYRGSNYLEDLIENNYGGALLVDLSVKFGYESVDYGMACRYIEKLVKKYRNECLFVFSYNIDKPGFAYQLLPSVREYIVPVEIREGEGTRKEAISYLKGLIRESEYSQYANQAGEFMKLFSGNQFSQTDVLRAYDRFGPWCLNKNVLKAYDYSPLDTFMLDRGKTCASSYDKLKEMIGLTSVKEQIDHVIAADIVEKERKRRMGSAYQLGTMHMIFGGNPGTAKTTVAKLFAGIAKEKGILKSGVLVERGGMDLDGLGCVGAIRDAFAEAQGGVLFIDEAYSLKSDVAVTCLIQEMESRREEVIVILAGYTDRMKNFMKINEGLRSRIPYWIDFPDYSLDELSDIFRAMAKDRGFDIAPDAVMKVRDVLEKARHMEHFGNGRYVRNLLERSVQNQAIRLMATGRNLENVRKKELFLIKKDDISIPEEEVRKKREPGAAQKELDELIGLSSVKAVIHKAIAGFKMKKICMDKGLSKENPSLHMVFTGNPGTAKTTVARLFAEIMKDEKLLPSGRFVEAGRADLVADHVGATAPLVRGKFNEAQGGVLFIDEAYSLCDAYENGFGDEAIHTIVQEMENHRDDTIVIFAGYSEQMKHFLNRNPGMSSRIAFHVKFEDYSILELCDITKLMLSRKHMDITDAAMAKLKDIYADARRRSEFGNGRFVRKMLEEAEMNLAVRLEQVNEASLTPKLLTMIEEEDIPSPDIGNVQERKIGF